MTNVGIYVYDEVEVLDLAGPFEVFSTAFRLALRNDSKLLSHFRVFTIGEHREVVRARGNLCVLPRYDINDHPQIDLLVIPGGIVTHEMEKERVIAWIKAVAERAEVIASVCTGAFLLAQVGLLDGKSATTHWEDLDDLQEMFPNFTVKREVRWIDEGKVITAGGISAGIDMSLYLVARLYGERLARQTARQMEYQWDG